MGNWVVKVTPQPLFPRERKLVPIVMRLSGPHSLLGWVSKISFPRRFDPRTTQPLTRHYTGYSIAANLRGVERENATFIVHVVIGSKCARLRNCLRN